MTNSSNTPNQTNNAAQPNQPPRPNPFNRPANSPFNRPPAPPAAPNQSQQPGNLLRRAPFGSNERLTWTVSSLTQTAVRFQLNGLGDPFHRLLGTPLNVEYGNPLKVLEALQKDADLRDRLEACLNDSWAKYDFKGAALIYGWDVAIAQAFTQPTQPVIPPKVKNDDDDDSDADEELPDWLANPPKQKAAECLRAIDLGLVLNVLARVRSVVLVADTPLALEAGFLDATLLTDDPRMVALARATGCIEEVWSS
jgi:hypothetical protein